MPPIEQVQINRIGVDQIPLSKIDRLPPPVIETLPSPIVTKSTLEKPVIDLAVPRLDYPRIEVPISPSLDVPQKGGETRKEPEKKERALKDTTPLPSTPSPALPILSSPRIPPVQPLPVPNPLPVPSPVPERTMQVNIVGHEVNIPTPTAAIEAGATAVIGTTVTLVTALLVNQGRQLAAPVLQKLVRNKFKIKLKSIKPVLHFVEENGVVHVIRYDGEGVRLLNNNIENPEQYLRDLIDADRLFEADHKIIIDEPVRERFTKEGAKRFNYFVPAKKIAKKLAARFVFG
jgi:hypothetical protein